MARIVIRNLNCTDEDTGAYLYVGEGGMYVTKLEDAKVFHEGSKRTLARYGRYSQYQFIPVNVTRA